MESETTTIILGIPIPSNDPVFLTFVGVHVLFGLAAVVTGAVAMLSQKARFHHPIWTKFTSETFVAIGVSALWLGMPIIPLALAFYGAGIGLESIARGTLPLAMFGSSGYAKLMGRLAMPSLIAEAAPSLGALLLERFGRLRRTGDALAWR